MLSDPVDDGIDHLLGPASARATLVEYGDFECPDCLDAVPVVDGLREQFGDALRVAFRHFPLYSTHPNAAVAALAAEAAAAQGQFWPMHRALFAMQRKLGEIDPDRLALRVPGIEPYRFAADLRGERYAPRVRRDVESGRASGVTGTPTFFVNGERVRTDALQDAIRVVLLSS